MRWFRKRTNAQGETVKVGRVDSVLAATVIALVGFGIIMVYSASAIEATVRYHDPEYFLKRQFVFGLLGLGVMGVVSRVDYHKLRSLTYPVLGGVILLMIATVAGFGVNRGGATRWLALGPVMIQPAEMAKLALVLWLAYSLAKKAEKVKSFSVGFIPHVLTAGVLILLCMRQPDFGSAVVIAFLTFTLLFVAGARISYLLGAGVLTGAIGVQLIMMKSYRMARLEAFLDIAKHRQDIAYQPFQSVMSFGSGQVSGMGLGRGLQVLYLPEAHNDFIAAIIGEELGFIGIMALASVFLLIVARGIKAAFQAHDDFGSYLAFGISSMLGVQALVNMAVAMAILPTKGLTLPFVSYGGSSLLVNAAAVGILLNVSRQREVVGVQQESSHDDDIPAEASATVITEAREATG